MPHPIHDHGNPYAWEKASEDYARYRDIYPPSMYRAFIEMGIGAAGQRILDLGTGTGVIPRAMISSGASWEGTDPDPGQIEAARAMSAERGLSIPFSVGSAEAIDAPDGTYDAVTAVQCFFYFDRDRALPEIARVLKPGGLFAIATMMWLPYEDLLVDATEKLVLSYNPQWTGAGYRPRPLGGEWGSPRFAETSRRSWDESIPFTHEGWRGRLRACRGVGATLPPAQVEAFDRALADLLKAWPEHLAIRHHISSVVFQSLQK
jgi:SAM-dependent methyltransferase